MPINSAIEPLFQDRVISTDFSMNQYGFKRIDYHQDGGFPVLHSI